MKLFTKEIEKKLQSQFQYGADLDKQKVIAKIFNPYGKGYWFILNQDPNDTDYLWAIVDLHAIEAGSVSKKELETIEVGRFRLPLERDKGFSEISAKELWNGLLQGKRYGAGGAVCEQPLSAKESAEINKKVEKSENEKGKTEQIKKWLNTGLIGGRAVSGISNAAKQIGVSVSDIMHIKNNL
jgi:hypothetical protein